MSRVTRFRMCGAMALLLVAITFVVYWPILQDFFALDDFIWLHAANHGGLGTYMRNAFTFPAGSVVDAPTPFWRPLIDAYFYVGWRAFGDQPLAYHLTNLALHVLVAIGVMVVARNLTKSTAVAIAAGVLFTVFPGYDFAVTWVSSTTELMGAAWFLLTVTLFVLYRQEQERRLYSAALVAFLLALLSKESTVVLPPVLVVVSLAIDGWPTRASQVRLVREIIPFALLAMAYFIFLFSQEYQSTSESGLYEFGWHVFGNLWDYLKALTFPVAADRGDWVASIQALSASTFLAVVVLLSVKRDAVACALVAWVSLALLPYSFFPAGIEARYLYFASIPFSILVAYLAWKPVSGLRSRRLRPFAIASLSLLVVAVVVLSGIETQHRQSWISEQAEQYEILYKGVPAACGPLPAGATIYVLNPHHFDLFGVSTNMAMNLVYDNVSVSMHRDGQLPELAAFVESKCVVSYQGGSYVRKQAE